jgi:hypothetical protein
MLGTMANPLIPPPPPDALTFNRYGTVGFSSDRPDLTGRHVHVVHRVDGSVQVWQDKMQLYVMTGATVRYEQGQRFERRTPTWAIVVAIVFALMTAFLSLLFLLVKREEPVPTNAARFTDPHGRTLIVNLGA